MQKRKSEKKIDGKTNYNKIIMIDRFFETTF